ncbi:MAG: hypothetical protein FJ275_07415, partial [Planctomycetes bacterium]|nr:hypothetical protein [Planctomycetota bacterium]
MSSGATRHGSRGSGAIGYRDVLDGREVWVANHVSDSVSVIDTAPGSPTRFRVVATVQDIERSSMPPATIPRRRSSRSTPPTAPSS